VMTDQVYSLRSLCRRLLCVPWDEAVQPGIKARKQDLALRLQELYKADTLIIRRETGVPNSIQRYPPVQKRKQLDSSLLFRGPTIWKDETVLSF